MYLNIPYYQRDFAPPPADREWEAVGEDSFVCQLRGGEMRVFRYGPDKPWWGECDNPVFEAKGWFWTAEQAMHWCEEELKSWLE